MPNKIKIFYDGPSILEIKKKKTVKISGYTFNPSLFRALGIKDYLVGCKKIIKYTRSLSTSLEVIADSEKEMIKQSEILSSIGKNVYVKIPVTYTNGNSTLNVLKHLVKNNIKFNVTAITTFAQIRKIINVVYDSKAILSIFAGRIYDSGIDAQNYTSPIIKFIKKESNCETLWASARMVYDIYKAENVNYDIITLNSALIKKIKNFKKNLNQVSKETVSQFFNDAKKSKYKI
jgi:transaldolase